MNLNKKDFLSAVEFSDRVTKGSPKGHCPSANQLRLTASGAQLLVEATDGTQYGWRKTGPVGPDLPPTCVSAANLKTILGLCGDKVKAELVEGKLVIKSGDSVFKLNTFNPVDFPNAPTEEQKETNWPAGDLADAMERVCFASADSPSVAEKWGVHVSVQEKALVCDAYSGIQYARVEKALKKPTAGAFFIPLGFLPNLAEELREKDAKFSFSDKTVKVSHPAGGYVCALANVKPLSVEAYLGMKRDAVGKLNAAAWLPFFRAAAALGGDKLSCKVTIDGKNFYHAGASGENVVPLPAPLKACNLNLNAVTFSRILDSLEPGEAELSVTDARAIFIKQGDFLACSAQLRET